MNFNLRKNILAAAVLSMAVFAVPSDVLAEEIGPGIPKATEAVIPEIPEIPADTPDYFLNQLAEPVVLETELYTYDQMSRDIFRLKELYGEHMEIRSIGKTADNRELYAVMVGNPNAERHLLIQGGIHGREYITSLLIMKQMEYMLAFYNTGAYHSQSLAGLLDKTAIHFVPMVNPDGVSISQLREGGIGSEELKQAVRNAYQTDVNNRRTSKSYDSYLLKWKSNAKGVDLNHNFDAQWGTLNGTPYPASEDYKGTNPLSEPETISLSSVLEQYPVRACINYHAMGQIIYWDVAGNKQREPSLQLARMFSRTTGYRISNELGRGGFKDWIQIKENAIPSVTLELGRTPCPVPIGEFPEIWAQNRSGAVMAAEFVSQLN